MRGYGGDGVGKRGHRGGRLWFNMRTLVEILCSLSVHRDIRLSQEVMVSEYFPSQLSTFFYIS